MAGNREVGPGRMGTIAWFLLALVVSLVLVHYVRGQGLPPDKWLPHRYIGTVTAADVDSGDSFTCQISNDFGLGIHARIRLAKIDTPPMTGKDRSSGIAARDALARLIVGQPVYLQVLVTKAGHPLRWFDRTWAQAWIERDGQLVDVAGLLISAGHGRPIPGDSGRIPSDDE